MKEIKKEKVKPKFHKGDDVDRCARLCITKEDKELLLKDLGARLFYGVKVLNMAEGVNEVCELDSIMTSRKHKDKIFVSLTLFEDSIMTGIEMVKPYLRPMSSMTEEEYKELKLISPYYGFAPYEYIYDWCPNYEMIDFCNKNHFDYRDLIEKGLALEATEGMYN